MSVSNPDVLLPPRSVEISRQTAETKIRGSLCLDGSGEAVVQTGLGFLDHMLCSLTKHAGFNLELRCEGDLHIDDHHTVEDCALAIGAAVDLCLGDRRGITRFGDAMVPLDEALARAAVDCGGRPWPAIDLGLRRERIGEVACENLQHFLQSLAMASRSNLHVDVLRGENDHHRVEAAFKATAVALRKAVLRVSDQIPSTKGVL